MLAPALVTLALSVTSAPAPTPPVATVSADGSALATSEAVTDGSAPAAEASLPDALPPLDERLLAIPGAPPVRAFAQGRLRGELDDSRDFARVDDSAVGATLTGRVGVEATANGARAIVVVGDGGRIGQRVRAPELVPRPVASPLYQAELGFDVALLGFPAAISFGRAPLVVADGRWVGAEPWDPRGRSFDGARAALHGERWEALVAAIWLGPSAIDEDALTEAASGLLVLSGRTRPIEATILDVYAFLHRDGRDLALPLTIPTGGARVQVHLGEPSVVGVDVVVGADVQAAVTDQRSASLIAGASGHAEVSVRVSTELSSLTDIAPDPFVSMAIEATGGDNVGGRSWRAPAPTQHGALGQLDLFGPDNTWSAVGALGGTTPGGLLLEGGVRLVGIVDPMGPFVNAEGAPIGGRRTGAGVALVEGAGQLVVPLRGASLLSVSYAIGIPGVALSGDTPAQRLLISLSFAVDSDDASPLPPLE